LQEESNLGDVEIEIAISNYEKKKISFSPKIDNLKRGKTDQPTDESD